MTNFEPLWLLGLVAFLLLVLPVGTILFGFAWLACRHERRWAAAAVGGISAMGAALTGWLATRASPDLAIAAVAFAAPAVLGVATWARPTELARRLLLAAAAFPALAFAWIWAADAFGLI